MSPEIRIITTKDPLYAQMLALRDDVLRRPLGMSVYNDDLSSELQELLIVAVSGDAVIGCVIIRPLGTGAGKLRQMAVAAEAQGLGIGALLVKAAERQLLTEGYTLIELNARATAIPFYEKLGYAAAGDVFTEVGIPHRHMTKLLG